MRIRWILAGLVILVAGAGFAWWQRTPLQSWWHVRQLIGADDRNRDARVRCVLALEETALPRLLAALGDADEIACANVEAALAGLAERWSKSGPRAAELIQTMYGRFASLGPTGQACALRVATISLRAGEDKEPLAASVAQATGDLIQAGQGIETLRPQVLHLAGALLARVPPGQWLNPCRGLALQGLRDANPKSRVAALHVASCEALRTDADFIKHALPLLRDQDPGVRRAAVLALGPAQDLVSEDDLLPLLHDPEAEVRLLCELALRSRGLQDRHLELARLITDGDPMARLRVVQLVQRGSDVDAGVWLRKLSEDAAPAVRAAAVRAAGSQAQVDLRERLREISSRDASPTVRELAAYYLSRNR